MELLFAVRPEKDTEEIVKTCNGQDVNDLTLFLDNHVNKAIPLILRSGCADVASKWTHEYLKTAIQDGLEVDVDIAPPSSCGLFPDTKEERHALGIEEKLVPFASVLDGTCKPTPEHFAYVQQQSWPFDIVFPKLSNDLKMLSGPIIRKLSEFSAAKIFWFGISPTRSQLHFDRKNNFICQMCGWKEILLFGPEETKFLYPRVSENSDDSFTNRFSRIDPNLSPECFHAKYPDVSKTIATRVILNPGDVLFVPTNWWHLVSSYTDPNRLTNIMVNMFFDKPNIK